jgi:hypothetical protein
VQPPAVEHDLNMAYRAAALAVGAGLAQWGWLITQPFLRAVGVADDLRGGTLEAVTLLAQLLIVFPFESIQAIA